MTDRGDRPSASASERWINCSASHHRCLSLPNETSEQAERGTMLHKACELYFGDAQNYIEFTNDFSAEDLVAVSFCVGEVEKLYEFENPVEILKTEERLWDANHSFSGQPDVLIIKENSAVVVDYKFGRGQVAKATGNWQLAILSVLVKENFPQVEYVDAYIIQPFAFDKERISSVRFDADSIEQIRKHIKKAILDIYYNPTEKFGSWCTFCKARNNCEAVRNELANVDQYDITPANAVEMFRKIKVVRSTLDAMEQKIKALAESEEIAGFKWVEGAKRSKLRDAQTIFGFYAQLISADEFIDVVDVSKTKLQKLYVDKMQRLEPSRSKAEIEREFNRTLLDSGLMEYVQNKPTLTLAD